MSCAAPPPDMDALVACAREIAGAMRKDAPPDSELRTFVTAMVFTPHADGGKDIWGSIQSALITEEEGATLLLAHAATWLSHLNGRNEPPSEDWCTTAIEATAEHALFGRAARPASSESQRKFEGLLEDGS